MENRESDNTVMKNTRCDRCKTPIGIGKSPYYDVRTAEYSRFSHKTEKYICEDCLFCDPRYVEKFGGAKCKVAKNSS